MRVLEVIRSLNTGGSQRLLLTRLSSEATRASSTLVFNTKPIETQMLGQFLASGISVINAKSSNPFSAHIQLISLVSDFKPDIVVVHSPLPAILLKISRLLGFLKVPIAEVVHSTQYTSRLVALFSVITNPGADILMPVSQGVGNSANLKFARRKKVLHHGVPYSSMQEWRAKSAGELCLTRGLLEQGEENPFVVVFCGRLSAQKRPRDILKALSNIRDPRIVTTIIGAGDEYEPVLEMSKSLPFRNKVQLLGDVPNAWKIMASADLLVLTSAVEGLGVVLMEAMALGLPCVATKIPGVQDIVEDGINGRLFEVGDTVELARLIESLGNDKLELQRLAQNAQASGSEWDSEKSSSSFYQTLGSVVANAGK